MSMEVYAFFCCLFNTDYNFHSAAFKFFIKPSELQGAALGGRAYFPFKLHGFPVGFPYPPDAGALGKSGRRKGSPLSESLAYAIVQACLVGSTPDESGNPAFFRFEKMEWG